MYWGKRIMAGSQARDSARLTLLALGEAADRTGLAAVTVADLCRWTALSERQVQYDLASLQKLGELEKVCSGGGRGRPAQYRIKLGWRAAFWSSKGPRRSEREQTR